MSWEGKKGLARKTNRVCYYLGAVGLQSTECFDDGASFSLHP